VRMIAPARRVQIGTAFVTAVILGGGVLFVLALAKASGHDLTGGDPVTFAVLATLLVIGELRPLRWIDRRVGADITVTWSFAVGLMLLAPLGAALGVLVLASLAGDFSSRKSARRMAFNAAQLALSLAAGAAVLDLFDARFALMRAPGPGWGWLGAAVLAGAAVYFSNNLLVSTVVALHEDVPVKAMVQTSLWDNLSTDGLLLALAPV